MSEIENKQIDQYLDGIPLSESVKKDPEGFEKAFMKNLDNGPYKEVYHPDDQPDDQPILFTTRQREVKPEAVRKSPEQIVQSLKEYAKRGLLAEGRMSYNMIAPSRFHPYSYAETMKTIQTDVLGKDWDSMSSKGKAAILLTNAILHTENISQATVIEHILQNYPEIHMHYPGIEDVMSNTIAKLRVRNSVKLEN